MRVDWWAGESTAQNDAVELPRDEEPVLDSEFLHRDPEFPGFQILFTSTSKFTRTPLLNWGALVEF